MAGSISARASALLFGAFFLSGLTQLAYAHGGNEAAPRSIDGQAVDQGVAYVLMLIALLVTYILH